MRHDIESCDQGGEGQDKTWLDGPVASMWGMAPNIHKTKHGPHHQRWPSPQDQGMHGTGRRAPQDIV